MSDECYVCLNTGVFGGNAVPMCELMGAEADFDALYPGFCPHCGAYCIFDYNLPPDSKFKVAGNGAYFQGI